MVREHLHACGAALLHSEWEGPLPTMIWPTNYVKLGAATMFTLFFSGKDFLRQTSSSATKTSKPIFSGTMSRHFVKWPRRCAGSQTSSDTAA